MIQPKFKVKPEVEKADYGKFIISPLAQGYGHTLGNSLRRVLLTSLEGTAVTEVKFKGIKHQFSTIEGVSEDVVEIILNIKKLRLKLEGDKPAQITVSVKRVGQLKASDIKTPARVKIVNQDLVLANVNNKKAKLEIEMKVEKGLGYVPFEEQKVEGLGVIPVDSLFTPVTRVNYQVEETRVGGMTNLDKLILEIWTDGTVTPLSALKKSAKILANYFKYLYEPKKSVVEEEEESVFASERLLKTTVEELELPTRITNALLRVEIKNLGQLLSKRREELLKIRNMGAKSVVLIEEKLKNKGLKLK